PRPVRPRARTRPRRAVSLRLGQTRQPLPCRCWSSSSWLCSSKHHPSQPPRLRSIAMNPKLKAAQDAAQAHVKRARELAEKAQNENRSFTEGEKADYDTEMAKARESLE